MNFPSLRTVLSRQTGLLVCLVVFCVSAIGEAQAQPRNNRPPARYFNFKEPSQVEGKKIMEEFRLKGPTGGYYIQFDLKVLPRRGVTQVVTGGKLWGDRNSKGPISRVELPSVGGAPPQRLLVQNGPQNSVWLGSANGINASALDASALFKPLAGTDLTAFDLQMPFLYWNDYIFEGLAPVRGRPAHVFIMYPPADITALKPELAGIRVYLDSQFGALVQFEQIGADEKILKSMTVLDLKKVDDQWMVKTIDIRDEATRNKTQFSVTGAAMGLEFSGVLFDPETLSQPITPPPAARVHPLQ